MMNDVSRQNGAYRQGLILGLTMAELLLLLVFCLLIGMAAILGNERLKLTTLEEQLQRIEAEKAELASLLDQVRDATRLAALAPDRPADPLNPNAQPGATTDAPARTAVDDTWDRLVAADRTVRALKDAGLNGPVTPEDAAFLSKVAPLAKGRSAEEVLDAVAVADTLRDRLRITDREIGAEDIDRFVEDVAARETAALEERTRLEREVADLQADLEGVRRARPGRPTDLPPIITLKEDEGFLFATGSARLGPAVAARLHDETAARLADLVSRFDVDVIEVVGHTDERPVGRDKTSNLDTALLSAVAGPGGIDALVPADNAGLGLARAVAVAKVLKSDRRLSGLDILPLSAAQLIDTDGRLTRGERVGDVAERRRIEIRLRRSDEG